MPVGKAKRVIDGDTFVLAGGEKVRIAELDTPELGEKEGKLLKSDYGRFCRKVSRSGFPNPWQDHTIGQ